MVHTPRRIAELVFMAVAVFHISHSQRRQCIEEWLQIGYRLNATSPESFKAPSHEECSDTCSANQSCWSYNYQPDSFVCELLDISIFTDAEKLIPAEGWVYLSNWEHKCYGDPCNGRGRCTVVNDAFHCDCEFGYERKWVNIEGISELALNKAAVQSSRSNAFLAVDGVENTDYFSGSCTHTDEETNPWWRVDLEDRYEVSKVAIVNRGDCCGERINGFQLTVGDSLENNGNNNEVCVEGGTICLGQKKEFVCNQPLRGRFVNIMIPGPNIFLTLCEVQVFGIP